MDSGAILIPNEVEDVVKNDPNISITEWFNVMIRRLPPYFWALTYGECIGDKLRCRKRLNIH